MSNIAIGANGKRYRIIPYLIDKWILTEVSTPTTKEEETDE